MGSAFFTKWSSAEDNGNCQGHYEERKRALCGTENVCHTRLYILIFSWDFRGCQTLPFLRGQTMPKFPKNRGCHRVTSLILKRAISHILPQLPFYLLFSPLPVLLFLLISSFSLSISLRIGQHSQQSWEPKRDYESFLVFPLFSSLFFLCEYLELIRKP